MRMLAPLLSTLLLPTSCQLAERAPRLWASAGHIRADAVKRGQPVEVRNNERRPLLLGGIDERWWNQGVPPSSVWSSPPARKSFRSFQRSLSTPTIRAHLRERS